METHDTNEAVAIAEPTETGFDFTPKKDTRKRDRKLYMREYRKRQRRGIELDGFNALEALPESERNALLAQEKRTADLNMQMSDCVAGIGYGHGKGAAGVNQLYPDLVFRECQEYLKDFGLVKFWIDQSLADVADFTGCDDEAFRRFGLRTRLVQFFYREFLINLIAWARAHSDECEPGVLTEAEILLAKMNPKMEQPTPATVPVLQRTRTKAEEEAAEAWKEINRQQTERFNRQYQDFLQQHAGGNL